MTQELKACPFCGCDAAVLGSPREWYAIRCANCPASLGYDSGDDGELDNEFLAASGAITAWNTRTHDPLVAELVEALEAAIKCHDSLCRSEFEGAGQYEPMLAVLTDARAVLTKAKGGEA